MDIIESIKLNSKISPQWKPIIINMVNEIEDSKRIKYLPKWLSKFVKDIINGDDEVTNVINSVTVSFGELKVRGVFDEKRTQMIKETQDTCKTICQGCGKGNPSRVVFKSWVHHYCKKCENDITARLNSCNEKC